MRSDAPPDRRATPAPPPPAPETAGRPRPSPRWRKALAGMVAAGLAVAIGACVAAVHMADGLNRARQLARQERWDEASAAVSRYLRLWPDDAKARLLAAELLVRGDDGRGGDRAAREALAHLDRVADDAPQGPEARLRSARLHLLVLRQPAAAEGQLRRAIARDPDLYEAHVFLWRVLDLTGRSEWTEPMFAAAMRLAPPDRRSLELRRWYLSQFAPASASLELDRLLGVLPPDGMPDLRTELARYEMFRKAEPDSPVHVAAAARLLLRNNESERAAALLDEFGREAARTDPAFAAARAKAAHASGDTATFEEVLSGWPRPREGYEFRKWDGVRLEEIAGDPAAAAESYRMALEAWPGPLDWQLMFRLSNCLRRIGRLAEAEQAKARSDEMERLLDEDAHRSLRLALADPADPTAADRAADFYDAIGRPWEAGLWRERAAQLRRTAPAGSRQHLSPAKTPAASPSARSDRFAP